MGGAALASSSVVELGPIIPIADGAGCQAHQATVPGAPRVGRAADRIASRLEPAERSADGVADVGAATVRRVGALLHPAHEAGHQIEFIEPITREKTVSQGERHAGIVGPFARLEAERTATFHVGQPWSAIAR